MDISREFCLNSFQPLGDSMEINLYAAWIGFVSLFALTVRANIRFTRALLNKGVKWGEIGPRIFLCIWGRHRFGDGTKFVPFELPDESCIRCGFTRKTKPPREIELPPYPGGRLRGH